MSAFVGRLDAVGVGVAFVHHSRQKGRPPPGTGPSGFRGVFARARVDPDGLPDGHVFGDLDDEPRRQGRRLGPGRHRPALDGRDGLDDLEVDEGRDLESQDPALGGDGDDPFEPLGEIGPLVLDLLLRQRELAVVLEVHEGDARGVAVEVLDRPALEVGFVEHVVAVERLVGLALRLQVAEADLVDGHGAARGRLLDLDRLDDVGVAVDLDDVPLLQVGCSEHGCSSTLSLIANLPRAGEK
ncbi:MAG: hypothetical protein MZV63_65290 [Marinilabiliales bacterium]|nr:hypothetical protein [Marinilabiliales bacterium]